MSVSTIPIAVDDPINSQILKISEDLIKGFATTPFATISDRSGVDIDTVIQRIKAMLEAGVIRRVRQTVLSTSLAHGALIAWQVPADQLDEAFTYMSKTDPFSGHVVLRTADPATKGAHYKLWTTLKVPQGFSLDKHCQLLMKLTGATAYRIMPAKRLFALGVGHVRRRELGPGAKTDAPGRIIETQLVDLDDLQWKILTILKREFAVDEITTEPWRNRAKEAQVDYETFCKVARQLNEKGVIGRFSTFLEHVKKVDGSGRVTRFNALFHWQVPEGREIEAGTEIGRFHCITHAYWREGGPEFRNVNIMAVTHGLDKDLVMEHKKAIDQHLKECGIGFDYTSVFWGGRSEIKPSEIMPDAYKKFCKSVGVDPQTMLAD